MTTTPSILITGCSHAGKSKLSALLAAQLGFEHMQTDALARHPGRPWPEPKAPVVEYFNGLSSQTHYWLLQAHYENLQFQVHTLINDRLAASRPFVFEGSAIRPELLNHQSETKLLKLCLSASEITVRERIRASCDWQNLSPALQTAVEAFTARSLMDNEALKRSAQANGFELSTTDEVGAIEALAKRLRAHFEF